MQREGGIDEVLQSEVDDLKKMIKCGACNARKKDTVLTKCYHCFCKQCIQTRIDTRQRSCPQCARKFGANDFATLYLT